MGIRGAFVVPHPPIIVEEVGHRREKSVEEVINAYRQVARKIAAWKPDTIIITSPHTEFYADYFHIAGGKEAVGDFEEFGAPKVTFDVAYDWEFTGELVKLLEEHDFPGGFLGERNKKLDHGVMVPLYFIQKEYRDFEMVRIGLSGLPLEAHYTLGEYLKQVANQLGRNVVVVASGDLSHRLAEDGPYGFQKEGPEYDEQIMKTLESGELAQLLDYSPGFCERAGECGHKSFVIMAGALDGLAIRSKRLAYAGPFGVGYGVCSIEVTGEDEQRLLTEIRRKKPKREKEWESMDQKQNPYTRIARESLLHYFQTRKAMQISDEIPEELRSEKAGAFVSLKKHGQLRGCIGTISPVRESLAEEIIHNAISSAVSDPRFPPVSKEELEDITISVDVLGRAEAIRSVEELDVKRFGVIVSNGCRRGLLLPDLEGVDTVSEQVAIAKRKAGIGEAEEVSLQRFEVKRYQEGEI